METKDEGYRSSCLLIKRNNTSRLLLTPEDPKTGAT